VTGDSIQKWKFNFDGVTTFVNDYPELEVREKDSSKMEDIKDIEDPLNKP